MNEKEIKNITKKSVVKAPHDFTDRLLYRIEDESIVNKPVHIPVPYMVMGALAFMGIVIVVTLSLPEFSLSGSLFSSSVPKRIFQVAMALFFLVAMQWFYGLLKEVKSIETPS